MTTYDSFYTDLSKPKIFFDVETPNCRNDRICAFCAASELGETLSSLVDPESEFHRVNTSIHGITADMVFDKPNFRAVWENGLRAFLENKTIVGYNVTFDLRVLSKTLTAYRLELPIMRYIDVLPAARRFFDLPYYSLSDVMEEMGVSFRHHDASEDVYAVKLAFERIARDAPEFLKEKIYLFDDQTPKTSW